MTANWKLDWKENPMILKTAYQVKDRMASGGKTVQFGPHLVGTQRVWSVKEDRYDWSVWIFDITFEAKTSKETKVAFATCSDETFEDEGHALAWAFSMIAERAN